VRQCAQSEAFIANPFEQRLNDAGLRRLDLKKAVPVTLLGPVRIAVWRPTNEDVPLSDLAELSEAELLRASLVQLQNALRLATDPE